MDHSNKLNRLLNFHNISIFRLWTRGICDTIGKFRPDYKTVFVYGISNGGVIADLLSMSCDPLDLVVVGDIFEEWRTLMWNTSIKQTYITEYLLYAALPFFSQTTRFDWMMHSKSKKAYTTAESKYKEIDRIIKIKEITLSTENKINVFYKTFIWHIPELTILEKLFNGKISGLKGVGINMNE